MNGCCRYYLLHPQTRLCPAFHRGPSSIHDLFGIEFQRVNVELAGLSL